MCWCELWMETAKRTLLCLPRVNVCNHSLVFKGTKVVLFLEVVEVEDYNYAKNVVVSSCRCVPCCCCCCCCCCSAIRTVHCFTGFLTTIHFELLSKLFSTVTYVICSVEFSITCYLRKRKTYERLLDATS